MQGHSADTTADEVNTGTPKPALPLSKVYVEPTSRCNLMCRTCMRNVWDEPLGNMTPGTFARVIDGLSAFDPRPTVFFGGIGEPLFHPGLVSMVEQAKAAGAPVEVITNGTLLDARYAQNLIAAGLDVLWVSLDGATPESYADVRLGAALLDVLANLARFQALCDSCRSPSPQIGIVFVAMKRNLADLPALLRLGKKLGAAQFMVSNVLPHTAAMCHEVLYARALSNNDYLSVPDLPQLRLPKMDRDRLSSDAIRQALRHEWSVELVRNGRRAMNDRCPFIQDGALAVSWEGHVAPCLPLLHTHTGYLHGVERVSRRYEIGNVNERCLSDIWRAPEHIAFRERVLNFEFSPCTLCDGCVLSENNDEDCYGNAFPTCGGCLWAQGIVQCP
jgi:MoaA/NifB/PqqE/SkfB family radical SAM enzyme